MITVEQFQALKPAAKANYVGDLVKQAEAIRDSAYRNSERRGRTQGYAFLWISLYGKDAISKAFVAYLNKNTTKLFKNYRGSKKAWYFGSQSDMGMYDGLKAMATFLNNSGIPCVLCDEWD